MILVKRLTYFVPAVVLAAALIVPASAPAATSSGTLTVTATVAASINMVFDSDGSGVPLTGTGTNTATLAFGTVQAFGGSVPTGATRTVNGTTDYTYSSPFDVKVVAANSSSANYTLTAKLGSADAVNTWKIDAITLTTSFQTITATGSYGGDQAHTVALTIPFTEADATSISNALAFTATAN